MNKKYAYLVVGCLASGKTFLSKLLFPNLDYITLDQFISGEWTEQKSYIAGDMAHDLIRKCIREGKNFILDSPKVRPKTRKEIIEVIRKESKEYKIVSIYVKASLEDCLYRNSKRGEHKEPEEQVRYYYDLIEKYPFSKEDGWDYLITIDNPIQEDEKEKEK